MNRLVCSLFIFLALAPLHLSGLAFAAQGSPPAQSANPKEIPLSGKVVETMNAGGYTYLLLKNGTEKNWIAIPLMKVSVGQKLTLIPGFEMRNFTSKGLNRTFDKIIFSAGPINAEKVVLSPSAIKMLHEGGPAAGQPGKTGTRAKSAAIAQKIPQKLGKVAKAMGPNAYTVAGLYANKSRLEKKIVVLRGRVVKVATHIMKRNWIHIQDGSGSPKRKNNDVVATSSQLPNEGDVVTVKGTLYNNINFGSGYKYKLIIIDASIKP
jgi:hypothetical protein